MQNIAIVGAGAMAATHARACQKLHDARLVGIMDVNPDAAAKLAAEFGVGAYDSIEALASALNPDVIDICVPTPYHADTVLKAIDVRPRGIIVEKPMARTISDCRRMIEACDKAGIPLFVAHVVRFFPEYSTAKAQIDAGAIGKPAAARTRRGGSLPRRVQCWYRDAAQSGGLLLDLLVHDFDWLRWCFGDVERVFARSVCSNEPEGSRLDVDYGLVTLRHASGVISHVEGTWADPAGFKTCFEIAGDEGLLEYNFNQPTSPAFSMALSYAEEGGNGMPIPENPMAVNPYEAEIDHFLQCIETGASPLVTPHDALEAVRIAEAAIESARIGRPINVASIEV